MPTAVSAWLVANSALAATAGKFPFIGSIAARVLGPRRSGLPANVGIPYAMSIGLRPGYFGAPRLATATHGERIWTALRDSTAAVALRVLAGRDHELTDRFATVMEGSAPDVRLDAASRRAEEVRAQRQRAWLSKHGVH